MSKTIKLLSIIETLGKGGAERVLVNTMPDLKKSGIECEVAILFDRDDLAKELEEKGIKVHRLNLSYKWNIFEGIYKLNRLIKKNQYDIVHAHLFFAYFYTGLIKVFNKNIKTVLTFHNLAYNAYPANTFIKKLRKKLDKFVVNKLIDKKTAVSNAVKQHFNKHLNVTNIEMIPNSFPIKNLRNYYEINENILKQYNLDNKDNFIILTPGRLVKEKGHLYLIEAVKILNKKYNNLIFLFVGEGPLKDNLRNIAPSNIYFLGEMSHDKLMKLYNEVDLVVIPSIHEAFGLVVGEAMIMKKSIIATDIDGIKEIIENTKEGLLVPPKNSKALADAIERLYKNKLLRMKLAENGYKKIQQFDSNIIIKKWKNFYEELINE